MQLPDEWVGGCGSMHAAGEQEHKCHNRVRYTNANRQLRQLCHDTTHVEVQLRQRLVVKQTSR